MTPRLFVPAVIAFSAVALVALAVACSSSDDSAPAPVVLGPDGAVITGSGPNGSFNIHDACVAYGKALCDDLTMCRPYYMLWPTAAECIDAYTQTCLDNQVMRNADPNAMVACLERRATASGCSSNVISTCQLLVHGTVPLGGTCETVEACQAGSVCDPETCGKCVPAPADAGASCHPFFGCDDTKGFTCSVTRSCILMAKRGEKCDSFNAPCDPSDPSSLVCQGGVCVPLPMTVGDHCDNWCGGLGKLYCNYQTEQCTATLPEGSPCDDRGGDHYACDPSQGLVCSPQGKCVFGYPRLGEPCNIMAPCWQSYCSVSHAPDDAGATGSCKPFPKLGEPCPDPQGFCVQPATCQNGMCAPVNFPALICPP